MECNTFYERLIFLLSTKNLKRATFARAIQIPESTIRQWERGSLPNIELAAKVAKFFNVTTDWLITGESENGQIVQETQFQIVESEEELIEVYRKLTEKQKETIKNLLDSMS